MDPFNQYNTGHPHPHDSIFTLPEFITGSSQHNQQPQHQQHEQQPYQQSFIAPSTSTQSYVPRTSPAYRPAPNPPAPAPAHDQATQLEILRETRRIRELELQIAEAGRQQSEAQRRAREAELAIAHFQSAPAAHGLPISHHSAGDGSIGFSNPNPNSNPSLHRAASNSSLSNAGYSNPNPNPSLHRAASNSSLHLAASNPGLPHSNTTPPSADTSPILNGAASLDWDTLLAGFHVAQHTAPYPAEYAPVLDAAQAQLISSLFPEPSLWTAESAVDFLGGALEPPMMPPLPPVETAGSTSGSGSGSVGGSGSTRGETPGSTSVSAGETPAGTSVSGGAELDLESPDAADDAAPAASTSASAAARGKRAAKLVEGHNVSCVKCGALMAKLLLRGSKDELEVPYEMQFTCLDCKPYTPAVPSRKRSAEMEDVSAPAMCDVCLHVKGHGGFIAKGRGVIAFTAEVMCLTCSEKYRRCTNCGGTSARGVIGKWRCKELFKGGRKTCSLSHARLGTRDMELVTCEMNSDLLDKTELPEILDHCEQMWREHVLSRLAVPEVLEHQSELTNYKDIEERYLKAGFPQKELFVNAPATPDHRRYITFSWAKARTRRDKTKPEWARCTADSKQPDQWLTYNMRRSTVLLPTNSILVGVWLVEWNVPHRTVVSDTLSPFDSTAMDERGVIHVSEMLRRALADLIQHNMAHPDARWMPPEHLWAVVMTTSWTSRLRISEGLLRRHFVPVEEYLARHSDVRRDMFGAGVCALARLLAERRTKKGNREPEVLVKFLGQELSLSGLDKYGAEHLRASIRRNR